MSRRLAFLLVVLLGGCGMIPEQRAERAVFDLGTALPAALPDVRLAVPMTLAQFSAAPGLESRAIVYRLAYQDAARLRTYSLSRWADEPAALVRQRVAAALGRVSDGGIVGLGEGVRVPHMLRVAVERFEQVVDAPQSARGVVRLRASLVDTRGQHLVAQSVFEAESRAATVDAPGAVQALREATDTAVERLVRWLAAQPAIRS